MIDLILFVFLCTVVQAAILRLWLDSYLFHPIQKGLEKRFTEAREKKSPLTMVYYLFQCWQCFGVWVGWLVAYTLARFIPASPIDENCPAAIFCIGLAVGLLSDLFEFFVLAKIPRGDFDG